MKCLLRLEKLFFYLLVFFVPLQLRLILRSYNSPFNEWASIYLYATDFLIAVIIILWVFRSIKKKKKDDGSPEVNLRAELYLAAFFVLCALSLLVADNLKLAAYGLIKLFEFILLYLYVRFNFQKLYALPNFFAAFIASASLQSVVAIVQFFKQSWLGLKFLSESPFSPNLIGVAKIVVGEEKIVRAYGLTPHPNILAAILIVAIFGLVYMFIKNYSASGIVKKIILGLVLALLCLALFFTFSRAVTAIGLGLLVVWLTPLIWRKGEFSKPALIVFLSLFIICLLLFIFFHSYIFARYDLNQLGNDPALDLRAHYNQSAWEIIKNVPFFGVGLNNFVWATSRMPFLPAWTYQPVHNIYMLIAVQSGIIAPLALLVFLLIIIVKSLKTKDLSGGEKLAANYLLLIVLFLLLSGLFDHFLWDQQQGQILLWVFLGLLASYSIGPRSQMSK